jgi:tetratricopeptide (TPR) repeat protein
MMDRRPSHHHDYLHPRRSEVMRLEKCNPNSIALADAYFQWAEVLKEQGDQDQAKLYFQKAIRIFDQSAHLHTEPEWSIMNHDLSERTTTSNDNE